MPINSIYIFLKTKNERNIFQKDKFIETVKYISEVARGSGEGENGELLLDGYGVSVWVEEKMLEIVAVKHCECN